MNGLKGNRGISLIEVVMGSLLMGILSLILISFNRIASKSQVVFEEQLSSIEDDALNYRIMHDDLIRAGASFEVLSRATPEGDFFDHTTESDCVKCSRAVTIASGPGVSEVNSIQLLVEEGRMAAGVSTLAPLSVYEATTAVGMSGPIQLSYSKLEAALRNLRAESDLSRSGRMLLLYSPERQLSQAGRTRMLTYLGVSRKDTSWRFEAPPEVGRQVTPGTGIEMQSVDAFFRNIPGGGGSLALVKPMKLVRYQLSPTRFKNVDTSRLIRSEYNGILGRFPNCVGASLETGCLVIGKHVRSVEFIRKEVASPVIDYRLTVDRFELDQKEPS